MPWARASSLHRFMACPASSWLPRWDDTRGVIKRPYMQNPPQENGMVALRPNEALLQVKPKVAAERGKAAHAAKERGELYPELWTGVDPNGSHELSFSYCCETGVVRTFRHENEHARDLWKGMQCEHAVVGTADWVGQVGGRLWVDDLKTGWQKPEVLTPQLLFYAMCWSDFARAPQPGVALSITHQPKAVGVPTREGLWRRATPMMIEQFRQDLTDAWVMTTLVRRAQPGEHCTWCPSAAWCSAARG